MLSLATEIEGHPDNVAASLLGGLVICDGAGCAPDRDAAGAGGGAGDPAQAGAVPSAAREALPEVVPLADAVHNLAQIAKLTAGLTTSDWGLIAAGLGDSLHQPYRAHLYPRSAGDHRASAADYGALGATISGAGPTVLIWCLRDSRGAELMQWLGEVADEWAEVTRLGVAVRGPLGASGHAASEHRYARRAVSFLRASFSPGGA